jgi:replicative DNA helicase
MVEQQYDALAEQSLIASIFETPDIVDELLEIIRPEDFFETRNSVLFQTIITLHYAGQPFDPVSVAGKLKVDGTSRMAGGVEYISEILTSPSRLLQYGSDPLGYAAIIKDLSTRRNLLNIAETITKNAKIGEGYSADEAVEEAEMSIVRLAQQETTSSKPISAADLYDPLMEKLAEEAKLPEGTTTGLASGFDDLDVMTNGWFPGQMIILAARPSVGKSALALDFSRHAAFCEGKTVLFFSLEMSPDSIMQRIIAAEANVKLQTLKTGRFTDEERMRILEAENRIKQNGHLLIDFPKDDVGLPHIRSRSLKQKLSPTGLDLVIIDYIQLLQMPRLGVGASRQEQVGAASRALKLLSQQLEVPIIVLAQLNRGPEQRQDKRPQLHDLRESGALEQDADIVLLIHRPEQSDPNIRPGEADLLVVKNRQGPTDRVVLCPMLEMGKYTQGTGIIQRDDVGENAQKYTSVPTPNNPQYPVETGTDDIKIEESNDEFDWE